MVSLVVFDIAGTTVTDNGSVSKSFRNAFQSQDLEVPEEAVQRVMGYRKTEAIQMLLRQFYAGHESRFDAWGSAIFSAFEQSMIDFYMADRFLSPLPGAESVFRHLHLMGIRVGLNTGFTRAITDAILYRLLWKDSPFIDAVVCSDEVPEGRPEPYMIRQLMRVTGIDDPALVAKVGDTEVDILEGRNAGVGLVVSVTTGAYKRDELLPFHPDHIINSLEDFIPLLISA